MTDNAAGPRKSDTLASARSLQLLVVATYLARHPCSRSAPRRGCAGRRRNRQDHPERSAGAAEPSGMDMRLELEKLREGLARQKADVHRRFVVVRRPETATSRATTEKLTRPLVDPATRNR